MERLLATMQLGFSVLSSMIASIGSGEAVEIPPEKFDPLAKPEKRSKVSPNQVRNLVSSMVELI